MSYGYFEFPSIGEGAARIVYDLGDGRVVKVDKAWPPRDPKITYSYYQGASEQERWKKTPETWMAPILDGGEGWVMMAKAVATLADKYGKTRAAEDSAEWNEARNSIMEQNHGEYLWDLHPWNVGWFGDNWKVIDYA